MMRHQLFTRLAGAFILLFAPSIANAGLLVQWTAADGGNGHYYEFVESSGLSWHQANTAADSMSLFGSPGHLVTVTSQAENDFLKATFGNLIGDPDPPPNHPVVVPGVFAWIGLTDEGTAGAFHWVTGEPFTYSNWGIGEPSTFAGYPNQDYVILWQRDYGSGPDFSWNDDFENPTALGSPGYGSYIVEFDGPFTAAPEPGTLTMAAIMVWQLCTFRCIGRLRRFRQTNRITPSWTR